MLTFKQFNEQGYPSADYDAKRDPDSEVKEFDPRSSGEDKFKAMHTTKAKIKDHPSALDVQFDGGTTKDKSKSQDEIEDDESGERKPVKQGTSEVKSKSGFGKSSKRRADKEEGDKKTPKIAEEGYIHESVIDDLKKIAKSGKSDTISFKNNSSMEVDKKSAETIVDAYEDLSGNRQKKFEQLLEKGESSFMKALDFANSV